MVPLSTVKGTNMKNRILAIAAAALLTLGFTAVGASSANAVLRTSFPAYSTVISPIGIPPAPLYSNGVKKVVNLAACPTGKANQQVFYQYIRFAGATQPNWSAPIKIEVCR